MSLVSALAITSADGEIVLDAELPEPKLDLPANTDYPGLLDFVRATP